MCWRALPIIRSTASGNCFRGGGNPADNVV
jgi:hypothetical protein